MLTRGIYNQSLHEPPPLPTYLRVERFRLDVSESDQQLIDAGVGQPDRWRPAVEVRLQHGVNQETGVRQPDWWRPAVEVRLQHGVNQETGVGLPDWWRPAVEVRLQHDVNQDRCRAARLVAPRSGGTSTTRRQPRDRWRAARLVAPRSGGTSTTRR